MAAAAMAAAPVRAQSYPEPKGPVNDFVGVILQEDQEALDTLGMNVWKATYAELAVVVVRQPGPWGMQSYAQELMKYWNLGAGILNNGVLILISIDERRVHIEVGRDLAVILPPHVLENVVNGKIMPSIQRGNYSKAARAGMEAVAGVLYAAAEKPPTRPLSSAVSRPVAEISISEWILFAAIAVLLLLFIFLCLTWISPDMKKLSDNLSAVFFGAAPALHHRGGFGVRINIGARRIY